MRIAILEDDPDQLALLQRWLAQDEKLGYVYRTGKPRSRWVWRLPEGAEFEIPGMD